MQTGVDGGFVPWDHQHSRSNPGARADISLKSFVTLRSPRAPRRALMGATAFGGGEQAGRTRPNLGDRVGIAAADSGVEPRKSAKMQFDRTANMMLDRGHPIRRSNKANPRRRLGWRERL